MINGINYMGLIHHDPTQSGDRKEIGSVVTSTSTGKVYIKHGHGDYDWNEVKRETKKIFYEVYGLVNSNQGTNFISEIFEKSFETYEQAEEYIYSNDTIYADNIIKKVYRCE